MGIYANIIFKEVSEVRNRIKNLRIANNISQAELGNKVNASNQAISAYESGFRNPKPETWQALADFFGVSVPYLQGAYNEEEIAKYVQDRRLDDIKQEKGRIFLIFQPVTSETIENYLIAIGIIPYDIRKDKNLLTQDQINNLDFWVKVLKPLYNDVAMKWLITKPNLDANKEDVLSAVNSAMNTIINASMTAYNKYDIFEFNVEMEQVIKNHYLAKRQEFLKPFTYWKTIETAPDHYERYPVYDFKHPHALDGEDHYIEETE